MKEIKSSIISLIKLFTITLLLTLKCNSYAEETTISNTQEIKKRFIISPITSVTTLQYTTPDRNTVTRNLVSQKDSQELLENKGIQVKEKLGLINGAVVELTNSEAQSLTPELLAENLVIEPDYKMYLDVTTPNDEYYTTFQNNMRVTRMNQAWDLETGDGSVVVGVIDSGIDYTHPDIQANIWNNTQEIAGNNLDDDSNGYVDDIYGYDFYNEDDDPYDDNSHGTHCAGTIGAVGNNNIGVTGTAWNVKLLALKTANYQGLSYTSDIIRAIEYAIDLKNNGVNIRVLSASLGSINSETIALQNAINTAFNSDIVFVAAAGNSNSNNDLTPFYPASYNNVVSVAAFDEINSTLSYYSNYGLQTVDIAAPGDSILSTVPGGYSAYSGTSMATPQVSGAIALASMYRPDLTASELVSRLLANVTLITSLDGKVVTGGILNGYTTVGGSLYSISGTIKDEADQPLSNVTVSSTGQNPTQTNQNGVYTFNELLEGSAYSVTASKDGYNFSTLATSSGFISSNLTIDFTGTIDGSYISPTPTATPSVTPTAENTATPVPTNTTTPTNTFNPDPIQPTSTPIVIPSPVDTQTAISTIKNIKYYDIRGKIKFNRKPLSKVKLSGLGTSIKSNNKGNFKFPNILENTNYRIKIYKAKSSFSPKRLIGVLTKNKKYTIKGICS